MRCIIRPATANTRRKELLIKMKMPREAFEEIFKELAEGDAVGVERDPATGWLVPTDPKGGVNRFDFMIKRGSVTDKLFHGMLDVPAPPEPKRQRKVAEVAEIGEEDIYEVEAVVGSRKVGQKRKRTEYQVKWLGWPEDKNTWEPASHINPSLVAAFEGKPLRAVRSSVPTLHKRGSGCAKVLLSHAAQKRGVVPETMSMLCGNWMVKFRESQDSFEDAHPRADDVCADDGQERPYQVPYQLRARHAGAASPAGESAAPQDDRRSNESVRCDDGAGDDRHGIIVGVQGPAKTSADRGAAGGVGVDHGLSTSGLCLPFGAPPPSLPPMVAEPIDEEMAELELPPSLFEYEAVKLSMRLRGEALSPEEQPVLKKAKARRGAGAEADELREKLAIAEAKIRQLESAPRAANGDALLKLDASEHEKKEAMRRRAHADRKTKVARQDAAEVKEQRNKANLRVVEMKTLMTRQELAIKRLATQVQTKGEQLNKQVEKNWALRDEQLRLQSELIAPERFEEMQAKYQEQLDIKYELQEQLDAAQLESEEMQERQDQLEVDLADALDAGRVDKRSSDVHAPVNLKTMKQECGVKVKYSSVPARARPEADQGREWRLNSVRHMAAVLEGRGEGEDINNVAEALQRAGYLERLLEADRFQPIAKGIAKNAVQKTQSHWTARMAVHVWDRLELTCSQMQTLAHLLSFIYKPAKDRYERICAWVNPNDSGDVVPVARLASRHARELEFQAIASTMNIRVGANGRVERDAVECTSHLYTNYASALRDTYTTDRPAQPVLYLDGTGGPLGRGICHGEMGCADFKKVGDSDAKQSRATLQPLFLYQGNDHAEPLRSNLDVAIKSYNKLVKAGAFDRVSVKGVTETIPARPLTAADMQGAKSTYGMHECSHSVWCKCKNDGAGSAHHAFTSKHMDTYEDMCTYCEETVGCEIKTHDEMCSWAHYSPGVAKGGKFTKFKCSCCGYEPTEKQWYADLAAWALKTDEERALAEAEHRDAGDPLNSTQQHHHQRLYMTPLPEHGMERCGVDNLHLTYLNAFKHLFKYTVHEGLPETKKKLVSAYLRDVKFYSYDASSLEDDPVSHWIGREVKRFIDEAAAHLPFLLQIAAAPADAVAEMAACANLDGEQEMDFDPEYAPTVEEVEAEEELLPLMMQNAQRWDNFLAYVHAITAEWPQGEADTDEYRKGRALEAFNLGNKVAIDIHELKPTMLTWVPHIMCFIVPRQMVELGDPSRRSCDACESFGAMVKKLIKHATCRRPVTGTTQVQHGQKRKGAADRRWQQTFKVGFIEQAFKRTCVRESLQYGEENVPYGQRIDYRRTGQGKAGSNKKYVSVDTPVAAKPSIFEAATVYEASRKMSVA